MTCCLLGIASLDHYLRSSLHESGLRFNPERHFKLNSCLKKITAKENLIPDWNSMSQQSTKCTNNPIFPVILALIHLNMYVNKTSHFANNHYFGHNERRFHSEFHSRVKFRPKFTWLRIDISFRMECSIRNEIKMEWARSGMSCNQWTL